jgi:hypothetical protein
MKQAVTTNLLRAVSTGALDMFFDFLPLILMPFVLATVVTLNLVATGSRNELEENSPDYARMLYRPLTRQLLGRAYPVRCFVLFFEPAPSAVKGSVAALRIVFIVHSILAALFVVFAVLG